MRNKIAWTALAAILMVGNAYADLTVCPAVADIKASEFTSSDPNIPAPYNEGFQYTAPSASGKQWEGETLATKDSFLDREYELKADAVKEMDDKTVCEYGGKKIGNSEPYLKLTLKK
ncbi:hypothetical protein [Pseudomonas huanghezhanensis]|uniref:hypothetical protein n=1 Tax=Pseudomonas huanghezhanensis TaxID=3002903 RepID=UPI00228685D2|nr:hypothetical protein [Pseudomonas sp. BSw22131]